MMQIDTLTEAKEMVEQALKGRKKLKSLADNYVTGLSPTASRAKAQRYNMQCSDIMVHQVEPVERWLRAWALSLTDEKTN